MKYRSRIFGLIILTFLLLLIQLSYETLIKELLIPSTGVVSPPPPFSPLHIGNEKVGENPCFFYDANGRVVTIRILGQYDFWPGYGSCWKSIREQLEINKNVSANCIRIQLYPERLFVAGRGIGWEQNPTVAEHFNELIQLLKFIVGNNSYYVLTWYFRAGDPYWLPNWWVDEANTYSIFWNETVQQDFLWMLNQTFFRISMETINGYSLLDYMVYWSFNEWLWTVGDMRDGANNNYGDMARNPWRFGGRTYSGISLTPSPSARALANYSWTKWLKKRYNGDINALKDAWNVTNNYGDWNTQTVQFWNYNGQETDDFGSLFMPVGFAGVHSGRWYDFTQWYHGCMLNFTRKCRDFVRENFGSKVYYGADTYSPIDNFYCKMDRCAFSPASHALVADVLIYHIYATYHYVSTSDKGWFQGDWYQSLWMDIGAFGRAAKKPTIVDECGYSPWWTTLAVNNWEYWIVGYQNVSTSLAIQNGIAGLGQWYGCIRWYSTNNAAWRTQKYQKLMKEIFDKYKAAENWIDKVRYDKICVVEHIYGNGLTRYVLQWLKEAGYNPAYKVLAWNETHFIPEIPEDAQIVIADPSCGGNIYIANRTVSVYNQSISEGKKLIIFGVRKGGGVAWKGFNAPWEQHISREYLPIENAAYGENYWIQENNTVVHVSVYGREIAIRRDASNGWDARATVIWNDADITGVRLINFTDGMQDNGNPQPFCIVNSHVAWMANLLGETSEYYEEAAYRGGVKRDSGYGLIFRRILEYWGMYPTVQVVALDSSSIEQVEVTYACLAQNHGVLVLHNLNFTHGNFMFKLNATRTGLSIANSYIILVEEKDTLLGPFSLSQLQNDPLSLDLITNQTVILVLKAADNPGFLYSTVRYVRESYNNDILTVNLFANSESEVSIKFYRAGKEVTSCTINGNSVAYSIEGDLVVISTRVQEDYSYLVVTLT